MVFRLFASTIPPKILHTFSLHFWITSTLPHLRYRGFNPNISRFASDFASRSLFLQKYMQYPRFAALLRLSMKYDMEGVRKILVHRIQKHYPVGIFDYEQVMKVHGTAAAATFTLPPHPNEVLKLFWECDVKQCLPVAFYEATVRGVNSLTSSRPKVSLPKHILTPAFKALAIFNSKNADHVRDTLDTLRACNICRRTNLISIEHSLLPNRIDLSLSPLRVRELKSDVLKIPCETCTTETLDDGRAFRYAFWDELPGMFGLPTWRELSKFVILK